MTIQHFIESAVEGGWRPYWHEPFTENTTDIKGYFSDVIPEERRVDSMLLDPEAWKAVGKVEKGAVCICGTQGPLHTQQCPCVSLDDRATYLMHCMIDALAEGKTIEQYLETLG